MNYHILFSLLSSIEGLVKKERNSKQPKLEGLLLEWIFDSFKFLCGMSSPTSRWFKFVGSDEDKLTKIIRTQQSALISTLSLKGEV